MEQDGVGYDLHCAKDDEEIHVDVKGVSGADPTVILTADEFDRAQNDKQFELFIVTEALTEYVSFGIWRGGEILETFEATPQDLFCYRAVADGVDLDEDRASTMLLGHRAGDGAR